MYYKRTSAVSKLIFLSSFFLAFSFDIAVLCHIFLAVVLGIFILNHRFSYGLLFEQVSAKVVFIIHLEFLMMNENTDLFMP